MTHSSITLAFRCSPRCVKATWHRSNPSSCCSICHFGDGFCRQNCT